MNIASKSLAPKATGSSPPSGDLTTYLREIARTPLLTADEEKSLARAMQAGRSARATLLDPGLDLDMAECRGLASLVRSGDEARGRLIRSNLRLSVRIARGFVGRGLVMDDLIQEANVGLVAGVDRFDPAMDNKLSTYANYWIKQAIIQAIKDKGTMVRVPSYAFELAVKWRNTAKAMGDRMGRSPTASEVSREMRLTDQQTEIVANAIKAIAMRQAMGAENSGAPDEKGGGWNPVEAVQCREVEPRSDFERRDLIARMLCCLDCLDKRSQIVLRMRYGLDGQPPKKFREIGVLLKVGRERVRQIEFSALAKLMRNLAPFAERENDEDEIGGRTGKSRRAATRDRGVPHLSETREIAASGAYSSATCLPIESLESARSRAPLSEPEQLVLSGICRDVGGDSKNTRDYDRRLIARRFANRTGRTIAFDLINRVLVEKFGVRFGDHAFLGPAKTA